MQTVGRPTILLSMYPFTGGFQGIWPEVYDSYFAKQLSVAAS